MWGENLLNLFICSLCKQKLVCKKKDISLQCYQCSRKFAIIDGIVGAFVLTEGLKSSNIDLPKQYEWWGEFVTRRETRKQRKDITVALVEDNLGKIDLFKE